MRAACAGVDQAEPRATGRPPSPCRSRPPRRAARCRGRCRSRSHGAKVWPKLRIARSPASRSSLATTCGLDVARARHRVRRAQRLSRASSAGRLRLDPAEECVVGDRAVLDDLGQARRPARARGSVSSMSTSAITAQRLVEGADHVLAERMVDRRSCRRPRSRPGRAASSAPGRRRRRACSRRRRSRRDRRRRRRRARTPSCCDRNARASMRVEDRLQRLPGLVRFAVRQRDRRRPSDRAPRAPPRGARRTSGATVSLLTMTALLPRGRSP